MLLQRKNTCDTFKNLFAEKHRCFRLAVGGSRKFWWGGDLKHKTSKIRMSSPKLRVIFSAEIGNSNAFFAQIQVVSQKEKKKKRSSPKLRVIFGRNRKFKRFFAQIQVVSKKKKKKKKGLHQN